MTVSPAPLSSARASSTPAPLRDRLRRAARVLAVAAGLLLPLSSVAPALAATPAPSPSPTPAHAGLQLTLLPDANGAYTPGSPLTTTLAVRNDDTVGLAPGTMHLELGRTPLADRSAVSAWLRGSGSSPALTGIGDASTSATGAGDSYRTTVVVPAADVGALTPGVYPLRATIQAQTAAGTPHQSTASSVSVLVVARGAAPSVLTVVPITAAPAAGDLLTATELTALTAPTGALTAQLTGVTGTSAVLAIDPSIPAAIRVLGTTAPPSATAWLSRLEALSNEKLVLQFGDADVAAQAAAGLRSPLTVDSLDPFLSSSGTATPVPTPSPGAGASTAPAPADVMTIAGARDDILWPRGEVSAGDIATMANYASAPATTAFPILPSTTFSSGAKSGPVSAHGTVGGASVLVTDAAVSAALSSAAVEPDATRRGRSLAEANAMLWFATPGSTVLAGLSRADVRSDQGLSAAVSTFSGGIDGHLSQVLSAPSVDLTVATSSAADRANAVRTLESDEARILDFASILAQPADLTIRQRISVLRLLGVGVHTTTADFATALKAQRAATEKTLDAVAIQPSNPILISAKVDVPVWVRNDLPYPVRVQLHITANDGRIQLPALTEIDAQPSSTTRVKIPVEVRLSNAEVGLTMRLTSTSGVAIGASQTAQLTIRAEWETIGLIVLGSIAVLLIGGGIFRTVRRRRAAAAKYAAVGMDGSGEGGGESAADSDEGSSE
ncbi:DUF6049 family protein [Microbacterium capsulatum]|uniref:DUF6049 family protein n=1 Tax=Microbacterium capsulatum TaxID=3041921 RepID=A0ABU0XJ02_9MICO|nr:DUF6049 family protein [Microbacterium sp. ASV81]MDQ4214822.1 DUF6049 family protein [Microbacterium sp. ASV81]